MNSAKSVTRKLMYEIMNEIGIENTGLIMIILHNLVKEKITFDEISSKLYELKKEK